MKPRLIALALTLIIVLFISILLIPILSYAAIVFQINFEEGAFVDWDWRGNCCAHSQQIVTSPVRAGTYAARFEVKSTDPDVVGAPRSQINYVDSAFGDIGGADEWYGFSTYLADDYGVDNSGATIVQWRGTPDPGEAGRGAVLHIDTDNGDWKIWLRHSPKPIQLTDNDETTLVLLEQTPYQTGAWIDWVVHVKWSYQSDGFTEIWRNGVKVVDYTGPNSFNDENNIWFALALYEWSWAGVGPPAGITEQVVYHDEVRIGDAASSFSEVSVLLMFPGAAAIPVTTAPGTVTLPGSVGTPTTTAPGTATFAGNPGVPTTTASGTATLPGTTGIPTSP